MIRTQRHSHKHNSPSNMATDQRRTLGSFRQAVPIMVACALTWSIGTMTNFILPTGQDSRKIIYQRQTEVIDLPGPSRKVDSYRQVYFIDKSQLSMVDMYSATWIQPISTFLDMDVQRIKTVEDGCFQAIGPKLDKVRMTLDWLDFSVEHMSKVRW